MDGPDTPYSIILDGRPDAFPGYFQVKATEPQSDKVDLASETYSSYLNGILSNLLAFVDTGTEVSRKKVDVRNEYVAVFRGQAENFVKGSNALDALRETGFSYGAFNREMRYIDDAQDVTKIVHIKMEDGLASGLEINTRDGIFSSDQQALILDMSKVLTTIRVVFERQGKGIGERFGTADIKRACVLQRDYYYRKLADIAETALGDVNNDKVESRVAFASQAQP